MPYAVTHILTALILVELFRDYIFKNNRIFSRYYILIAAIGSVIPDLDIAAYYFLYFFGFSYEAIHRTFLHTIFVPLAFFIIGFIFLKIGTKTKRISEKHMKLPGIFFILSFTCLLHLILDSIFWGSIVPLYPLSNYQIGLNFVSLVPIAFQDIFIPTIEGILLLAWIFWMEFKLKVRNYF